MDSKLNARLSEPPSRVTGKGPEELRRELGLDALVNLASNENPLGPSPLAVAAARKALDRVHRYPDWAEGELERKLVARCGEGLTEDHVIVGNGAVDVVGTGEMQISSSSTAGQR